MSAPSLDRWLAEAKAAPGAAQCGMYLSHRGVVRGTSRAQVRLGQTDAPPVTAMACTCDRAEAAAAEAEARALPGIHYVRVWLAEGVLAVGDDIMQVLIGGDIRPHVLAALDTLVTRLKTRCITEQER